MKILYIAPMNSIHSRRWIKYFVDQGNDVHAVNVGLADRSELEKVTVHFEQLDHTEYMVLIDFFVRFIRFFIKLKKLVSELKPDIIHVHGVSIYAYIAVKCSESKIPVIATAWGSDILLYPYQSYKRKIIAKLTLKAVDFNLCDEKHIKNEMIKLGADEKKIGIVYFGTDLNEYNSDNKDLNVISELGFKSNTKLIISLRQLKPIYDIETLIKAIPLVIEKNSKVGFIIVGEGSEKQNLEELSKELGIDHKVRFTGFLSYSDLKRYTASADIYVSTSTSDAGLASSTAEAMASEVPVIITDFGNNSDWVEDKVSGLLFPMRDYKVLSDKIIYILEHPDESILMANKGMQIIKERNNWLVEMEKVNQIYIEIIKCK
jgi:L-malate glycosyltransferase